MFHEFGNTVRVARTEKGITLNDFAKRIGVSVGYLSNLETSKTDTISFDVLQKINDELHLFPSPSYIESENNVFSQRTEQLVNSLKKLHQHNPQLSIYFIKMVEDGIDLLDKE
ncbi:helix-turn-helix domain-containing protein [Alkalihalophilus marmarensis]|uniref:helix-turn-helix domain-containing protein n=1 Tax=Alkalihalophilus marmarensis TaxID=521377 RepID=UPI002DB915A3|nr:helix-turn-helix transcriptional regulator [Alkalihalophilus marmarensis]MEC2073755.1 helix-turn-helix transcriptional regulator [Alkalihalophilus marmarensis]